MDGCMNRKILVAALAAALSVGGLVAISAPAQAAGQPGESGTRLKRAKEQLGITDAQAAEIRAVLKGERETLARLSRSILDSRAALREVIRDAEAGEADVRAASFRLARAQADMAVVRHQIFVRIKPILTAAQLGAMTQVQGRVDALLEGAIESFEQGLAE